MSLLSANATSLTEMPENFLIKICPYLARKDLLSLSSTCQYLNKLYSTDEVWQSHFEECLAKNCISKTQINTCSPLKNICQQIWHKSTKQPQCSSESVNNNTESKSSESIVRKQESVKECDSKTGLKNSSATEVRSEVELSSHSYVVAPSSSFLSVYQRGSSLKVDMKHENVPAIRNQPSIVLFDDLDQENGGVLKISLRRRFKSLLDKTEKLECEEDYLPGDRTIKYALKYLED